jgi:hypothetical protein
MIWKPFAPFRPVIAAARAETVIEFARNERQFRNDKQNKRNPFVLISDYILDISKNW